MRKYIFIFITLFLFLTACSSDKTETKRHEEQINQIVKESLRFHHSETLFQYEMILKRIIEGEDLRVVEGMLDAYSIQNNLYFLRLNEIKQVLSEEQENEIYALYKSLSQHSRLLKEQIIEGELPSNPNIQEISDSINEIKDISFDSNKLDGQLKEIKKLNSLLRDDNERRSPEN
ncbi:hypothetical protein [Bacillus marinisedimentorum]|uniref:hypothetical protein n=1 Tax=Bacillus marinisedimentorum TaxID=1821260 RepID=UPI0008721F6F|nr:hypothetical protein [Bacillus marinisedimentorum]